MDEKAIENRIDFRTCFEWYRNQEDYENQCKIEIGDLKYVDKSLEAVRKAIMAMLDDCVNLRVARKPRLEMKVDKRGISLNVSQLKYIWMSLRSKESLLRMLFSGISGTCLI